MTDDDFGATSLPRPVIEGMQRGIMKWSYRGRPTWKSPLDLALYLDVLWEVRPRSVVEFGSNRGGSALWFADQLTSFGDGEAHVWSLDIDPVTDLDDPRITFGSCDVAEPEAHVGIDDLRGLPKPLLVIDDASHRAAHVLAVLRFVDQALEPGDYLIVEDGVLSHLGWDDEYEGGPLLRSAPSSPRSANATRSTATAATSTGRTRPGTPRDISGG
jgi:cephalosporin hydroxylase